MDIGRKIDLNAYKEQIAKGEEVLPLVFYQEDEPKFVLIPYETFRNWLDSEKID